MFVVDLFFNGEARVASAILLGARKSGIAERMYAWEAIQHHGKWWGENTISKQSTNQDNRGFLVQG